MPFVPGARIEHHMGNLNFFFIRETTSIREVGTLLNVPYLGNNFFGFGDLEENYSFIAFFFSSCWFFRLDAIPVRI
jgi:hypothetical protein